MNDAVLRAALEYHQLGWSTFPMRADERKKPAVKWGPLQNDRASEGQLRGWFGNSSDYGIAVIFGQVSGGLGSRDFDQKDAYDAWSRENSKLAGTLPTVATGRGQHVYFRMTVDQEAAVRAALGKPQGRGAVPFDDGELRIGTGCYSVLPPSRHPNGVTYRWMKPPTAEVPIVDVREAGFLKGTLCHRETRETREHRDTRECPEDTLVSMCHGPIEAAIANTMPTGFRQRHELLFEFARELKAIPGLSQASAHDLKVFVRQWHEAAKPYLRWPFEETWLDFIESWEKVKFPKGKGPVEMAFQRALESELPEAALEYEQKELRQLVGFCRELQRGAGPDNDFYLAARVAGRLLDKSWSQVARYLRLLRHDRIIELTERCDVTNRKTHRYRYLKEL